MAIFERNYQPLIDKINQYSSRKFFSIEFFPPRTETGVKNWVKNVEQFRDGHPLFVDITWHVRDDKHYQLHSPISSLSMANILLNYLQMDTMLHLTCINLTEQHLDSYLERAKYYGIRNILALRGDRNENYDDNSNNQFQYASDLVSYIRAKYEDYFTICVAGYPIPHSESKNLVEDRLNLKKKIDSGSDFMITQFFFNCQDYIDFHRQCRQIGINVHIIPGICSINSYESIRKISKLSSVTIPEKLLKRLEELRDNQQAIQELGCHFLADLCRQLLATNLFPGIHFYTINQSTIIKVIKMIGLWQQYSLINESKIFLSPIPWYNRLINHKRLNEMIRPIFWSNRSHSYINRTYHWSEYPSSSWTLEHSNSISRSHDNFPQCFQNFSIAKSIKNELISSLFDFEDLEQLLATIFDQYFKSLSIDYDRNNNIIENGNDSRLIKSQQISLPWFDYDSSNTNVSRHIETLLEKYGNLIHKGLLITNYLPSYMSGKVIDDSTWYNDHNGVNDCHFICRQNEFIEFFISLNRLSCIEKLIKSINSDQNSNIKYMICNYNSSIRWTNWNENNEILIIKSFEYEHQTRPIYIADHITFEIWKNETFSLMKSLLNELAIIVDNDGGHNTNGDIDRNNNNDDDYYYLNQFLLVCLIDFDCKNPNTDRLNDLLNELLFE